MTTEDDEKPSAATHINVGNDVTGSAIVSGDHNTIHIGTSPTPRPTPSPLFTIPAPPTNFTGREAEINDLLAHFAQSAGVAISGLSGGGGVGKSALARVIAERLAQQYPDARLQIDLQGAPHPGQKPLTPVDALRRLLQSFHPTAQLPDDLPSLQAILTDTLRGKRVLFLLDNARDAAQVRPLLPPAPSAAIVTSRTRIILTEQGLYAKPLGALKPDEARKLLRQSAPILQTAADATVDALARQCGALPLALNIAAALLASRDDWTPPHLIKLLADERTRLQRLKMEDDPDLDVEASLELSYKQLSEENQRRFRTLGIFPAPFDLPALAPLWDLPLEACDEAIGPLLRLSLLETHPADLMPYQLHDLTRIYAESLLRRQPEEWTSAVQRHADYFLQQGWENDQLYKQGHEHVLESLRHFDLIWPHLQAAYERNLQNAGAEQTDDWLNKFLSKVVHTLDLRLTPRQQIPLLESALSAARRLNDIFREGVHLGNLGISYYYLGEARRAIGYYEQHQKISRDLGDQKGEGQDLGHLGNAYYSLGELDKAIGYYEQALEMACALSDKRGEGDALGNLGNVYSEIGELDKAIGYHKQALEIDRALGDRRGEGYSLCNLGSTYSDLGKFHRAVAYYEQSLLIARELGDQRGEHNSLLGLGTAYADLGELDKAMDYYEQALVIAREIGDVSGEAIDCWNMGMLLEAQGQFQSAAELMQMRVDYYNVVEHPEASAFAERVKEVRRKAGN